MTKLSALKEELKNCSRPEKIEVFRRFFKTGKGQYGEGDRFIGVTVPDQRKTARNFFHLPLEDISKLLYDRVHEYRLTALLILVERFNKSSQDEQQKIVDFYLAHALRVNNWDLVDLSAPKILGPWFLNRDKSLLYDCARSGNLWKERIAVMATYHFIKNDSFDDIFIMAKMFITHSHDLIHKAVGWMLREVGKRDIDAEKAFLHGNYKKMPRTMLRYAIEKFNTAERDLYLKGLA